METRALVRKVIAEFALPNWLAEYPWLVGALGDPAAAIWFVGENPSMRGVISVHNAASEHSANLQWNSHAGDLLFRAALTEAGLKTGDPARDEGWRCFITNAIKTPEVVRERNDKKRKRDYWRQQAEIWWPVLQAQIDGGKPAVLVCLGRQAKMIIDYMVSLGLRAPRLDQVEHYSYIMLRPEAASGRGPRHPDRICEFKASIKAVASKYGGDEPIQAAEQPSRAAAQSHPRDNVRLNNHSNHATSSSAMTPSALKEYLAKLVAQINSEGHNLAVHQQKVMEKHIAVIGANGRICLEPLREGYDISLSGLSLERQMSPFMCELCEKPQTGYKQLNRNRGTATQPYWRVHTLDLVEKAIRQYATTLTSLPRR